MRSGNRDGGGNRDRCWCGLLSLWLDRNLRRPLRFDRKDETVAELGEGLDVAGLGGGIVEDGAKLLDRGVEAVLEVDKGVGGPELLVKLIAANDFASVGEENRKDLKRLGPEFKALAELEEFPGGKTKLVRAKTGYRRNVCHGGSTKGELSPPQEYYIVAWKYRAFLSPESTSK